MSYAGEYSEHTEQRRVKLSRDEWKARALKAEAEAKRLRAQLASARNPVPVNHDIRITSGESE